MKKSAHYSDLTSDWESNPSCYKSQTTKTFNLADALLAEEARLFFRVEKQ